MHDERGRRRGESGQLGGREPGVHQTPRWGAGHRVLREYVEAHEQLQDRPETVPVEVLPAITSRLRDESASEEDRKAVLILLAHHKSERAAKELEWYLRKPDPALESFARLALEEAQEWVASGGRVARNQACLCGSGLKYKHCCEAKRP